jgi:hypothetical protein
VVRHDRAQPQLQVSPLGDEMVDHFGLVSEARLAEALV